jgi:hypothetical protein
MISPFTLSSPQNFNTSAMTGLPLDQLGPLNFQAGRPIAPFPQDGTSFSAEAGQPEAPMNDLLSAFSQAWAPQSGVMPVASAAPASMESPVQDPIAQLQQQAAQLQQQLSQAQLTGDSQAVASLTPRIEELLAQLMQLLAAQNGGGAGAGRGGGGGGGGGGGLTSGGSNSTGSGSYSGSSGGAVASSGSSGSSGASVAPVGGSSGKATPGAKSMLERAGAMVGMGESSNRDEIMKITGQSGIDPSTTPWCAAYAMNLIEDHGLANLDGLSNRNYCPTIESWAREKGIYGTPDKYTPKPGDAILFDWEGGKGETDHIGLVEKVKNGKVYTIEGNSSDSVKRNVYDLGDSVIDGYVVTKDKKEKKAASSSKGSGKSSTSSSSSSSSTGRSSNSSHTSSTGSSGSSGSTGSTGSSSTSSSSSSTAKAKPAAPSTSSATSTTSKNKD